MANPIYISGRGLITACGHNCRDFFTALTAGQSGLKSLTLFQSPRCGHFPVGQVTADLASLSNHHGSRSEQLALIAASEAIEESGLSPADLADAAIVTGACTGGMRTSEALIEQLVKDEDIDFKQFASHECCKTSACLMERFGITGPQLTLSTACTSGALAIAVGADLIKSGQAEVVLCGGVDSLTKLTLNGFASLLVVSPSGPKPFDAKRQGMSLGEGAAYVILESAAHLTARQGRALAQLSGYGVTCDGFHASSPHPEGLGAIRAMNEALTMASLNPSDIGYINAHGTGTRDNDSVEALAIAKVFNHVPPVSSTKGFYGHPLAASGAIEAVLATMVIAEQWLPPNLGLEETDEAVTFTPLKKPLTAPVSHVMSNSFGFGGNNTVLIISKVYSETTAHTSKSTITVSAAPKPLTLAIKTSAALWPESSPCNYTCPEIFSGREFAVKGISGTPWKSLLPIAKLRRLGHVQIVALTAAQMAINKLAIQDPEAAVITATGLGEFSETYLFLENMFKNNEATPMPTKFINSVHNSLAGQLAIWHHLTGANHTFTENNLSLSAALWQAALLLQEKRCHESLIVSADTITPYSLHAATALGTIGPKRLAGEGGAAFIATAPAPGEVTVSIYWGYNKELLSDVNMVAVGTMADLPEDLPQTVAVATWEEATGYFMTSDGLALNAVIETLKNGQLTNQLTLRKDQVGSCNKAAILRRFGNSFSTIIVSKLF